MGVTLAFDAPGRVSPRLGLPLPLPFPTLGGTKRLEQDVGDTLCLDWPQNPLQPAVRR